jgi:hypothetical protein
MATPTLGFQEGGTSRHGRMPTGWRIAGFTVRAAGFWLMDTGAEFFCRRGPVNASFYPAVNFAHEVQDLHLGFEDP